MMIIDSIVILLSTCFVIIILHKFGVINYVQLRSNSDIVIKLSECDFCMSFWIGVIMILLRFIVIGFDIEYCIIPVLISPLARKLLK